jgi:hypothetical protein
VKVKLGVSLSRDLCEDDAAAKEHQLWCCVLETLVPSKRVSFLLFFSLETAYVRDFVLLFVAIAFSAPVLCGFG